MFRIYDIFLVLLLRSFHWRVSSKHRLWNITIYFWTHLLFCSYTWAALKSFSKLRNLLHFCWAFSKIHYKICIKIIKKLLCIKLNTNCFIFFAFRIALFLIIWSCYMLLHSTVIYKINLPSHMRWRCYKFIFNIFIILHFYTS